MMPRRSFSIPTAALATLALLLSACDAGQDPKEGKLDSVPVAGLVRIEHVIGNHDAFIGEEPLPSLFLFAEFTEGGLPTGRDSALATGFEKIPTDDCVAEDELPTTAEGTLSIADRIEVESPGGTVSLESFSHEGGVSYLPDLETAGSPNDLASFFQASADYRFSSVGGQRRSFNVEATAPGSLKLTQPEANARVRASRGSGVPVTWISAGTEADIILQIVQMTSDGEENRWTCRMADDGSGSIPASVTSKLIPSSQDTLHARVTVGKIRIEVDDADSLTRITTILRTDSLFTLDVD